MKHKLILSFLVLSVLTLFNCKKKEKEVVSNESVAQNDTIVNDTLSNDTVQNCIPSIDTLFIESDVAMQAPDASVIEASGYYSFTFQNHCGEDSVVVIHFKRWYKGYDLSATPGMTVLTNESVYTDTNNIAQSFSEIKFKGNYQLKLDPSLLSSAEFLNKNKAVSVVMTFSQGMLDTLHISNQKLKVIDGQGGETWYDVPSRWWFDTEPGGYQEEFVPVCVGADVKDVYLIFDLSVNTPVNCGVRLWAEKTTDLSGQLLDCGGNYITF